MPPLSGSKKKSPNVENISGRNGSFSSHAHASASRSIASWLGVNVSADQLIAMGICGAGPGNRENSVRAGVPVFPVSRPGTTSGGFRHRSALQHFLHALDAFLEDCHAGGERGTEVVRCAEARARNHRDPGVVDEHL